jgi:membrane associated rhomboid family serine protease
MRGSGGQLLIGLKPTKAVIVLLAINIGMVIVSGVAANYLHTNILIEHLGLKPSAVVGSFELWQPFTYFWLHSVRDPLHILWNLLTLWLFSGPLQREWGTKHFVLFYMICGVGSGLVVLGAGLIWQPDTVTVGASGAILGLVAAFGLLFPNLPVYLFGVFPIKGRTLAIGFAILSTAIPLVYRHANVSVAAHIGGLVIGAVAATGYWRPSQLTRRIRLWRARKRLKALEGGKGGLGEGDGKGRYLH